MPELQFYAARDDVLAVLQFVLGETDCRVYEAYSEPDDELREFASVEEIDAAFSLGHDAHGHGAAPDLALWSPSTRGEARIERFELRVRGHSYRHEVIGWGLMQLQLGGVGPNGISVSRFAHNSEKRARAREDSYTDRLPAAAWDWDEIERVSRRIRNRIRRVARAKWGSGRGRLVRPVLPHAEQLWRDGVDLAPN